jgi:hypothetical protein
MEQDVARASGARRPPRPETAPLTAETSREQKLAGDQSLPAWAATIILAIALGGALYFAGVLGGSPPLGIHRWHVVLRLIVGAVLFVVFFVPLCGIGVALMVMFTPARRADDALPPTADHAPPEAPTVDELPPGAALDRDEQRIHERLNEIASQRTRIHTVQTLVERQKPGATLDSVREKLGYAEEVLDEQQSRHRAQLWMISLMRWQEKLASFTRTASGVVFGNAGKRLEELVSITAEGEAMLTTWREDARTASTREGARSVAHMGELLARCEQLREGIVVQEAMLAIRGIEPTDDVERTAALSIEPLESLQADLGEGGSLAAALIELELEHERLREDDQDARNVERFLGDLEGGRA